MPDIDKLKRKSDRGQAGVRMPADRVAPAAYKLKDVVLEVKFEDILVGLDDQALLHLKALVDEEVDVRLKDLPNPS